MAENTAPAADAAAQGTTTTTATQPVASPPAAAPARSDEPLYNKQEIVELRKETRENSALLKQLLGRTTEKPEPKPEPGTIASADAAELTRMNDKLAEIEFREACADADIKGEQRNALLKMWRGDGRPTEGLAEWVKANRVAFGNGSSTAPQPPATTAPGPAPTAPSDTGAPVTTAGSPTKPEGHPLSWSPDYVLKMEQESPGALRRAVQEFENKAGAGSPTKKFWDQRWNAKEERRTKALRENV